MNSSTLRRRRQKIERQWCRNARPSPSPTSLKPSPPWPGSSRKKLQDKAEGPNCRWIGRSKQIPSGWTRNTSETWEDTAGHTDTVWTSATTVKHVGATRSDSMGGKPYSKPRAWGRERVREIFSNTRINISHDLQVKDLYPIADSGATLNCLYMNIPSNYDKQIEPIRSLLPDGNKISAHIQCKIKMDEIAYKFNGIQEPLISIPVLCDNGCTVTFKKQTV